MNHKPPPQKLFLIQNWLSTQSPPFIYVQRTGSILNCYEKQFRQRHNCDRHCNKTNSRWYEIEREKMKAISYLYIHFYTVLNTISCSLLITIFCSLLITISCSLLNTIFRSLLNIKKIM